METSWARHARKRAGGYFSEGTAPCSFHCFLPTALSAVTSAKVWLASSAHTYTCMLCCCHSALHCTEFSEWIALCYHCIRKTANKVPQVQNSGKQLVWSGQGAEQSSKEGIIQECWGQGKRSIQERRYRAKGERPGPQMRGERPQRAAQQQPCRPQLGMAVAQPSKCQPWESMHC